jgi:hypothetical protein
MQVSKKAGTSRGGGSEAAVYKDFRRAACVEKMARSLLYCHLLPSLCETVSSCRDGAAIGIAPSLAISMETSFPTCRGVSESGQPIGDSDSPWSRISKRLGVTRRRFARYKICFVCSPTTGGRRASCFNCGWSSDWLPSAKVSSNRLPPRSGNRVGVSRCLSGERRF